MTTATEAVAALEQLIALPDTSGTAAGADANGPASKAAVIAIAEAAGLPANGFVPGDPSERWLEILGRAFAGWSTVVCQAGRAPFLALSTDPGDVDDFGTPDQSDDQTPRAGWLSAHGVSFAGVERRGQTFATSFVTIRNAGASTTDPFTAGQLFLEQTGASRDDGGTPTYVSTPDPSVYVGIGDTLTLAPSATAVIPVRATQIGEYGSAPVNTIDLVITQSFGNLVVDASTAAIGEEREARADYIEKCIISADKLAPGGPTQAYRFAMNTNRDGTPLQRHDGSGSVGIVNAQITVDSATGIVDAYFVDADGAADSTDVESANANIEGVVLGVITDPLGVVPDCVTYTGQAATEDSTNVTYSARIKASDVPGGATPDTYTTGGSPPAPIEAIFTTIAEAIGRFLPSLGPGALEQDMDGNGSVFTADIQDTIKESHGGLYGVSVSTPGSSTTSVPVGHVAIAGTITGTLVVV